MNLDYYVYELQYPQGNPFYVGKGRGCRILHHEWNATKGVKSHVCNKIRKIWRMGHKFVAIKVATELSDQQACEIERALISKYGRRQNGGLLVNLTNGGDGSEGYKHDLVSLAKMSAARDRYKWSDSTREKMRKAMVGRVVSEETRRKISLGVSGAKNWNFGKKLSEKRIAAIRKAIMKPVLVRGVRYESITLAARAIGMCNSTIYYRIRTKPQEYQYA